MEQTQKQKQNKGLRRFLWVLPLVALVFLALAVGKVMGFLRPHISPKLKKLFYGEAPEGEAETKPAA